MKKLAILLMLFVMSSIVQCSSSAVVKFIKNGETQGFDLRSGKPSEKKPRILDEDEIDYLQAHFRAREYAALLQSPEYQRIEGRCLKRAARLDNTIAEALKKQKEGMPLNEEEKELLAEFNLLWPTNNK